MKVEISKKKNKSVRERLKKYQDKILKRIKKGEKQDEHD